MFNAIGLVIFMFLAPVIFIAGVAFIIYQVGKFILAPVTQEEDISTVYINTEDENDSYIEEEKLEEKSIAPFRPTSFSEYIGQHKLKSHLMEFIASHKLRNMDRVEKNLDELPFPHFLISGGAGTGKTLLAQIIANQLDTKFVECISSELDSVETLQSKVKEADGGILFLDEAHSISRDMVESIYRIMEEFHSAKPFTLCGCTTELGEILENRKPFYDRFKLPMTLVPYTVYDLTEISEQYRKKQYPDDILDNSVYEIIAKNSKGTPRQAYKYLDSCIMLNGNIDKVLSFFNILKDGFSLVDYRVLEYLSKIDKPIGLKGLVTYLGTSEANFRYQIEPYLIQTGAIQGTSKGRIITDEGRVIFNDLKKLI